MADTLDSGSSSRKGIMGSNPIPRTKIKKYMASTKEFKEYILEQLEDLGGISCKPMMGEYLLYLNGILFGGIFDDRLLVKIVEQNKKYNMQEIIPYETAKPMFLVDEIDDRENLEKVILDTVNGLIKK